MNTKILQKNKLVEIETYVKNHTDKNISGLVVSLFFNGDRVAQRTVDFQAGQTKSLVIAAEPKDFGFYSAYVEIENDALEQDNKRFFGFFIPEKPNIAIIGSQDKSQFISLALSTKTSNENFVNYKAYTPNQINEIDLNSYEMLICAGGPYRESDFNRFLNYIKNGNSILMFADDKTDFNLFKRSMIQFNFGDLLMQEFKKEKPAGFVSVDKFHPIFEGVFKGTTDNKAIVESPKIFRLMATNSGQKIISTANGGFLNESKINDGKILFCGVSPDIEWSTFPITGMFPALLYRSVFYLSSRENLGMNITVGKTVNITLPKRFASGGNFIITDPKNNVSYRQAVMLPSGATISLDNLNILGVYSIKTAENKIAGIISVNPDPSESAVQQLKNDEIKSLIKERINNNSKLEIINPNNVTQNLQRARTGTELWQLFIILALISAITEMMIARASKKEKEG